MVTIRVTSVMTTSVVFAVDFRLSVQRAALHRIEVIRDSQLLPSIIEEQVLKDSQRAPENASDSILSGECAFFSSSSTCVFLIPRNITVVMMQRTLHRSEVSIDFLTLRVCIVAQFCGS